MAIDRAPWNALIDDDGLNLVGSLWNKAAIKTVILDPVDAAFQTPTYGTFTPIDASGGGLAFAFAKANWARVGRLVFIWLQVVYPGTSNASPARIGGLPAIVVDPGPGGSQGFGIHKLWSVVAGSTEITPLEPTTGAQSTNAQMSGLNVIVSAVYLTT